MLDLLYIAIVAVPLVLASGGLLLLAVKSFRSGSDARRARLAQDVAVAEAHPGGMRRRDAPLEAPPSVASLGRPGLGDRVRPHVPDPAPVVPPEISELAASLAFPPRRERTPATAPAAPLIDVAAAVADAAAGVPAVRPGLAAKRCPDCAEEVLAAARVCKHCRYRWDEPDAGLGALSA
jgi:hypothetical protein